MGVSGSGKSTIGSLLANALECAYLEGDELHPPANIASMRAGVPLDEAARAPWLAAIRAAMEQAAREDKCLVVACSALRAAHRRYLAENIDVTWIYLRGPAPIIRQRLAARTGHFAGEALLGSQLADLEEPDDAIVADITLPPAAIVEQLLVRVSGARTVRVFSDAGAMSAAAAEEVAAVLRATIELSGRCSLVLSGGDTPRGMYQALATRHRDDVPWEAVHVFWSDERYVPPNDARSNFRMAREALLAFLPCPLENVHPMPTQFDDPATAARAYEALLLGYADGMRPSFDVAILGIGADGHTASLFPHDDALDEVARSVLHVRRLDAEPPLRLTLSAPVLLASARSHVLANGAGKAAAVRRALDPATDPHDVPAAFLRRARGSVTWWLDRPAAAELDIPVEQPEEKTSMGNPFPRAGDQCR
jgi:6-phosphogluconolactonase